MKSTLGEPLKTTQQMANKRRRKSIEDFLLGYVGSCDWVVGRNNFVCAREVG